jgi:hypothetical protein
MGRVADQPRRATGGFRLQLTYGARDRNGLLLSRTAVPLNGPKTAAFPYRSPESCLFLSARPWLIGLTHIYEKRCCLRLVVQRIDRIDKVFGRLSRPIAACLPGLRSPS